MTVREETMYKIIEPPQTYCLGETDRADHLAPCSVWESQMAEHLHHVDAGAYKAALQAGCLHPIGVTALDRAVSSWKSIKDTQRVLWLHWGVDFGLRPTMPRTPALDLSDMPWALALVDQRESQFLGRSGGGYDTFHGSTQGQLGWQTATTVSSLQPEDLVIVDQATGERIDAFFRWVSSTDWWMKPHGVTPQWIMGFAHPDWPEYIRTEWEESIAQCYGSRVEQTEQFVEHYGRTALYELKCWMETL